MTVPLPIPDDPRIEGLLSDWNAGLFAHMPFPRSAWLGQIEGVLRDRYPIASSDELTLTARNLAPFPLALPNVP